MLEVHQRTGKELTSLVEYSVGVMGFHSLLQSRMIPWESAMAKGLNRTIFTAIKASADRHNHTVSQACPLSKRTGTEKRNTHVTAIAPTMSISSLCNVTSSGIEPWVTNAFTKKVKQGSFAIQNKYLHKAMVDYVATIGHTISTPLLDWVDEQWASIKKANGSVQHLDWMDQNTKDVFKTAFEIDQKWVIEFAGDRSPLVDQGQSLNIFVPGGSNVQYISDLHILAWKKKVKSLYYLRSTAVDRASTETNERKIINVTTIDELTSDSCIGCA